jgi:hypothetical protein
MLLQRQILLRRIRTQRDEKLGFCQTAAPIHQDEMGHRHYRARRGGRKNALPGELLLFLGQTLHAR